MLNTGNVVKQILKFRNMSQDKLAEKCGYANQSCISGVLNRGNMRIDNLYKIIDELGCEIIIKDKKSKQQWIIFDEKEKKV